MGSGKWKASESEPYSLKQESVPKMKSNSSPKMRPRPWISHGHVPDSSRRQPQSPNPMMGIMGRGLSHQHRSNATTSGDVAAPMVGAAVRGDVGVPVDWPARL